MNEPKALPVCEYPWTRVWSRDYSSVEWDSRTDDGTVEQFVIDAGFDWMPVTRDLTATDRWSGRLEVNRNGSVEAVSFIQEFEYLKRILNWPNPAFTESGYQQ